MSPSDFIRALQNAGITFFCGVPDSLLSPFCACIMDETDDAHHIIAANEGNAIGMAAGHYLASGHPGLVYMQNSGLGNAVNPLLSLMDEEVYSMPVLLIIGWRGQPGTKDEPQHVKQGKVTSDLLSAMGIPYAVLPKEQQEAEETLRLATQYMQDRRSPYALIIEKNTFAPYSLEKREPDYATLEREEAIQRIAELLGTDDLVVATTGKISRELFEYRAANGQGHHRDFLTVGSMGHASSIALGLALEKTHRTIICLEGDGALLMHSGALAVIGQKAPKNLVHIVLNNFAHDSVGGQPTAANKTDMPAIAFASGYKKACRVDNVQELNEILPLLLKNDGPAFLEVLVKKGSRSDLGRPTRSPAENRDDFMAFATSSDAPI